MPNDRDRDYLTSLFVRQYLGMEKAPPLGQMPIEAISAQAEVNINLRGMVHNIRQSIWVHSAEIAKRIEDQLVEACSEASVDKEIARAVAEEIAHVHRDIRATVHKTIEKLVLEAIEHAVGGGPAAIAKRFAEKMWNKIWEAAQ